jgi:glycerophosphoryl diester phosphodiesterase
VTPLLLGHRGARKHAPENTLPAFQLALEHGCDGFECDVRMTADAQAVICHDPRRRRRIVSRSKQAELELPTLEDVLCRFSQTAFLNIELKVTGLEECTIELLRRYPPQRGCMVSSFLPKVIENLARLYATVATGLICDSRRQFSRWKNLPIAAVMLNRGLISASLVDELHTAGKQVFMWTVNSPREMAKFADYGVDGIISDDTKLLASTFRQTNR